MTVSVVIDVDVDVNEEDEDEEDEEDDAVVVVALRPMGMTTPHSQLRQSSLVSPVFFSLTNFPLHPASVSSHKPSPANWDTKSSIIQETTTHHALSDKLLLPTYAQQPAAPESFEGRARIALVCRSRPGRVLALSRSIWRGNLADSHHDFWKQIVPADLMERLAVSKGSERGDRG
jgi:hypothetical protein